MVICFFPSVENTVNKFASDKTLKSSLNGNDVKADYVVKTTKYIKVRKKVKVKVAIKYKKKGKWRTKYRYKYVYRYYYKSVYTTYIVRDIPPRECTGATSNCQSNDPQIIAKMRELTTRTVTKPNPDPRPEKPVEPIKSNYINENLFNNAYANWLNSKPDESDLQFNKDGTFNETEYNAAYIQWVNLEPQRKDYVNETAFNNAYNDYLALKNIYDNYNDVITVKENLTDYEKSVNIYNYARDVEYSFYYNTRRGAINTMHDRYGNCCDITHLLIALSRAAGIPARYINADCTFLSGSRIGHVWAQVWINGRWYTADASNDINDFGIIRNWNTGTMHLKGIYSSLPF